mmetsp:Transcript_61747/g.134118  ORF Transcript_61747/g.134118 Transcript_61747/m.134118 type:complete len:477 (-) Transcript_61747:44-1474(-)
MAQPQLHNLIIWFNIAPNGGGAIYLAAALSLPSVSNCSVGFNVAELQGVIYPMTLANIIQSNSTNVVCSSRGNWTGAVANQCECPKSLIRGQMLDCDRDCPGDMAPPCSGHGTCVSAPSQTFARCESKAHLVICVNERQPICDCELGYMGEMCEQVCPGLSTDTVCSGHGQCVSYGGAPLCSCDFGWAHTDCSQVRLYIHATSSSSASNRVVRLGDIVVSNNDGRGLLLLALDRTNYTLPLVMDAEFDVYGRADRGDFYMKDGYAVDNDGLVNVNASTAANALPQEYKYYFREEEANRMATKLQTLNSSHIIIVASYGLWLNQTNTWLNTELVNVGSLDLTPYLGDKNGSAWSYALAGVKGVGGMSKMTATTFTELEVHLVWNGTYWGLTNRTADRLESWDLRTDLQSPRTLKWDHATCGKRRRVLVAATSDEVLGQKLLCVEHGLESPTVGHGNAALPDFVAEERFDEHLVSGTL